MGDHQALYDQRLYRLLRGESVDRPAGRILFLDPQAPASLLAKYPQGAVAGGTSNFFRMAAAGWLLWAVRFGTQEDVNDALVRSRDLADRERRQGMWLLEQTACDPHAQFHLSAMVGFRLAAREGKLADVLADSDQQWRWLIGLYSLGATPDGEIVLPCTRAGQDRGQRVYTLPVTQVGTAVYRLIKRLPLLGPSRKESWFQDSVYGGGAPLAVRSLLAAGDPFGGAAASSELPRLRLPMHTRRFESGHVAWLEGSRESQPIASWVRVEYAAPGKHRLTQGYDFESQPGLEPVGALLREERVA
jgi:hypothetical protein